MEMGMRMSMEMDMSISQETICVWNGSINASTVDRGSGKIRDLHLIGKLTPKSRLTKPRLEGN